MNKLLPIVIGVAIIVGVGAFYGGMKYVESRSSAGQFSRTDFQNLSPEERQQQFQELGANAGGALGGDHAGGGFRGRQRSGDGFTVGEIIAKDEASVTVKFQDGGSKIVFLSDSTEIAKTASGSLSDLEVGKTITVTGITNSDGSVTAQTIQLRPINR